MIVSLSHKSPEHRIVTVASVPAAPNPAHVAGGRGAPVPIARPGPLARALGRLDAIANRVYGSAYNPFYRSGAVTVALMVVLLVTGLYLLLFYRVGAPYASVARIDAQPWLGRWIRAVHRLSADAAVVTALVHALRMFAQRRSWGRRTMPWVTGIGLLALIMISGWTGYVLVWDTFGQALAVEGARVLDLLPLFSEPLGRAFVGERPIPGAFFFLNLFLHIALPIGMGVALLLHVSRVARAVLLPAKRAMWWGGAVLVFVSVAWPIGMAPEASAFTLPATVPLDVFYAFWLPVARAVPAWSLAAGALALTLVLLLVPRFTRPPRDAMGPASEVNERVCTGCEQCALDCPWEAITMVPRDDERPTLVARVDPSRCVSCGICAGSCAPMGVGPAWRTGRDQLAEARAFVTAHALRGDDVVVIACARGGGGAAGAESLDGAPVMGVQCAGSVHTSVIEHLVRSGAGGVLVLSCPMEDCWNREGTRWMQQRLWHEREAELQERVDRRRVADAHLSLGERAEALRALARLRTQVRALSEESAGEEPDLLRLCELAAEREASASGAGDAA
jgi:ferredoxin